MSSSGLGVFAGLQTTTVPYPLFFQMTKFKFKSQSPSAWDGLYRRAMNSLQKQLVFLLGKVDLDNSYRAAFYLQAVVTSIFY